MTDQELRKLSRRDLLELLIGKTRECEELQKKLENAEAAMQERLIQIGESGSIAEAALQINGVFEAAEAAARQYLENVQRQGREQEAELARQREEMARQEEETRLRCERLEKEAQEKAGEYWDDISRRLESFCREHEELRTLLAARGEP